MRTKLKVSTKAKAKVHLASDNSKVFLDLDLPAVVMWFSTASSARTFVLLRLRHLPLPLTGATSQAPAAGSMQTHQVYCRTWH